MRGERAFVAFGLGSEAKAAVVSSGHCEDVHAPLCEYLENTSSRIQSKILYME